ncbi:hypothetical protein [Leptospira santarosai]|uniref:hypothetical protein n=1 Tax=Leptospira santarosai TaxID=28183 RepID=UPI0002BE1388|nr:hypothetical protein [Leptospira santarosai]EMO70745.1 hypothetical protein LEP1GSC130_0118 [Leptospira santarosai str. 200403458]EMO99336.1 hypothetical protein LEP1GSC120_2615 [Leptospira santarosai str. 200702252]
MIKNENSPIATDSIDDNVNGSINALHKKCDIINGSSGDERLQSGIQLIEGYDSEFWIGEIEICSRIENITLTNNYVAGKQAKGNGFEVSFDSDSMYLKFNFDKFWSLSKVNSSQSITDELHRVLLEIGIVVKDWRYFCIEQASINRKIELNQSELKYFKSLLRYLYVRKAASWDRNGHFSIHKNAYRFVFNFDAASSNSILHIKLEILDGQDLRDMLVDPHLDWYDLTIEEARQILNRHLRDFRKECASLLVNNGWYVISDCEHYLRDLKADDLIENLRFQQNLIQEFNEMDLESFYKQYFEVSFQKMKATVIDWLKLTTSIKNDLQLIHQFISRTGITYGELLQKFEVYSLEARKLF